MKNILPLIPLVGVALMLAQAQRDQKANQPGSTDKQTMIQGCLSGTAGSYTLTVSSGQTFQLAGDTGKLNEQVGHKVEVAGSTLSSSSTGTSDSSTVNPSASGAASAQPTLNVKSVRKIADSCDTGR